MNGFSREPALAAPNRQAPTSTEKKKESKAGHRGFAGGRWQLHYVKFVLGAGVLPAPAFLALEKRPRWYARAREGALLLRSLLASASAFMAPRNNGGAAAPDRARHADPRASFVAIPFALCRLSSLQPCHVHVQ